ncbi:HU family DNA-binding protein [Candidatus Pelagibacter sp.]|nr:HU family DNA-binding protein [Candidatus Pelagibacter sp.]
MFTIIINTYNNNFYNQLIKCRQKKSRIGRNPKTKKEAMISERNVVLFKPSKEFKDFVNLKND